MFTLGDIIHLRDTRFQAIKCILISLRQIILLVQKSDHPTSNKYIKKHISYTVKYYY